MHPGYTHTSWRPLQSWRGCTLGILTHPGNLYNLGEGVTWVHSHILETCTILERVYPRYTHTSWRPVWSWRGCTLGILTHPGDLYNLGEGGAVWVGDGALVETLVWYLPCIDHERTARLKNTSFIDKLRPNRFQSVERLSCHMLWDSGTLDPGLKPQQCLYASMWIKTAQRPCWPPGCQQVLHQRWIWGICCMQVTNHGSEGIHPCFETQGRRHQKSKTLNRGMSGLQKRTGALRKPSRKAHIEHRQRSK